MIQHQKTNIIKKIYIIILLLLLTVIGYSQTSVDLKLSNRGFNVEKYIICVDNEDSEVYFSCLEYLEHSSKIKVFAICEDKCLIGFLATYKSYDTVKGVLMNEFPDMLLFKKDNEFLESECK